MTVDKSKRGIAAAEFVSQANVIVRKVNFIYDKIPQHRRNTCGKYLLDTAHELLKTVYMANTIYVSSKLTKEKRLSLLWDATGLCNALIGELNILLEDPPKKQVTRKNENGEEYKTWEESPKQLHYTELIGVVSNELALLKGARTAVKEYKVSGE